MNTIENQTYSQCDIKLDNNRFVRCIFTDCRFTFHGEGPFLLSHCNGYGDCFLAVHEDVLTIVEAIKELPLHGADELFSIISKYIQEQSSQEEYFESIRQRPSSDLLLNGKLNFTIEFLRNGRDAPPSMSANAYIDHIHKKIDIHTMDYQRAGSAIRDGAKYVYLPCDWMIKTWTDGGELPIRLASAYRAEERAKQMTPDENLTLNSNMSLEKARQLGFDFGNNVRFVAIENCMYANGMPIPDIRILEVSQHDGLTLCFANSFSTAIAARFDRRFCVKVENIHALKHWIDQQLGAEGTFGECEYTIDHNRNRFLKHIEDAWQDEFRIVWPTINKETTVRLPAGFASEVSITEFNNAPLDEFKRISSMYAKQLAEIDRRRIHRRPVPTPFD